MMSFKMLGLALGFCLLASPSPQKKEGVELITREALKAYSTQLAAKESTGGKRAKSANEPLGDRGNYTYAVIRRDENGEPEVHADWADLFVVQDGSASVLTGGKVKGTTREVSPGEQRGGEITGGTQQKIGPGDLLFIPATIPHQVFVSPGSFVTYFVVKIRKASP